MVAPHRLEPEVVEHAAVGEVDLADEPVAVGLVVVAAGERRRLPLRVHDAERPRDARRRRHRLRERPVAERPRSRPTGSRSRRSPVSKTHWSRKRMSLARKTKRGCSGRSVELARRRPLRVGVRERLALRVRARASFCGWRRAEGGARADVPAGEAPASASATPASKPSTGLPGSRSARGQEGRELRGHDAPARDRGERVDRGEDAELVQPAQRAQVEERRAIAAARHAERGALARSFFSGR